MHLQQVLCDIRTAFAPVEQSIASHFIPTILKYSKVIPANLLSILTLPVKLAGVGLSDPTPSATQNVAASTRCTAVLTEFLRSDDTDIDTDTGTDTNSSDPTTKAEEG